MGGWVPFTAVDHLCKLSEIYWNVLLHMGIYLCSDFILEYYVG
jgi:hypothetical protein